MHRGAEQLGLAAELMCQSPTYRNFPMACLAAWIKPAIEHQQVRFLFDASGNPLAYWTWAFLAPDVEERWKHDPKVLFHESEWNEGEQLWIMDMVCQRGYLRSIIAYIQSSMFSEHNEAFSLRRNKDGSVKKVSIWHRNEKFNTDYYSNSLINIMPKDAFAASRTEFLNARKNNQR